jgi:hypothetical protein
MSAWLLVPIVLCLQTPGGEPANDASAAKAKPNIAPASIEDVSQWLMNYYKQPDPETIPARVQRMSQLGMLSKRPHPQGFEMFFAQVMKKHPDKIEPWMKELADLPEAERKVLVQSVWMSQTPEGKKWLAAHNEKELAEKPGHPLTTSGPYVLEPYHLDMLWEWFFATGEKAPIEQIVGKFEMIPAEPGDNPQPPRPPAGVDRATQLRYAIGGSAVWSATSLAISHDKLYAILKEIEKDPRLPKRGGAWLKRVLKTVGEEREKVETKA